MLKKSGLVIFFLVGSFIIFNNLGKGCSRGVPPVFERQVFHYKNVANVFKESSIDSVQLIVDRDYNKIKLDDSTVEYPHEKAFNEIGLEMLKPHVVEGKMPLNDLIELLNETLGDPKGIYYITIEIIEPTDLLVLDDFFRKGGKIFFSDLSFVYRNFVNLKNIEFISESIKKGFIIGVRPNMNGKRLGGNPSSYAKAAYVIYHKNNASGIDKALFLK